MQPRESIAVVYPQGPAKTPLTAQDVAQRLEAVRDSGDVRVTNARRSGNDGGAAGLT